MPKYEKARLKTAWPLLCIFLPEQQGSIAVEVEVHFLAGGDSFLQGYFNDVGAVLGNHVAVLALHYQLAGLEAQTGAENTVEAGGGTAALDVAKHHGAALEEAALFIGSHESFKYCGKTSE